MSSNKIIIPEATVDPAAVANGVAFYAKDVGGVKQLFARGSDGTIRQINSAPAAGGDFATQIRVPTAFGGNFATVHNWNPPGFSSDTQVIVITSQDGGTQGIGGLVGGVDGRVVTIMKTFTPYPGSIPYAQGLFFVTEDLSSTDINRFAANWGNNSFGQRPSAFTCRYDGTINRWVPIFFQLNNT
jgi:hypothetical protein